MKILGLCGGSGSGKGLACSYFKSAGIDIIDTDLIYHQLISANTPCQKEIANEFGPSVLKDGIIDRKALANIVFASEEKRLILNSISHKHILNVVRKLILEYEEKGSIGVIVDAPLLFESKFNEECDATLCVLSDDNLRMNRIVSRDCISVEKARKRILSQMSNEQLSTLCDYVIENNGSPEQLKLKVLEIAKTFFEI